MRLGAWPPVRDWAEAAGMLALLAVAGGLISLWSPVLRFDPALPGLTADPARFLMLAALALVAPSLAEELVFRGALQPGRLDSPAALAASALSLIAFIVWHPVQVRTGWFTGQPIFQAPGFLVMAGLHDQRPSQREPVAGGDDALGRGDGLEGERARAGVLNLSRPGSSGPASRMTVPTPQAATHGSPGQAGRRQFWVARRNQRALPPLPSSGERGAVLIGHPGIRDRPNPSP